MKTATVTEAKNQLSALLDQVRSGETIVIMDRGRPVARLEPAVSLGEQPDGRLSRLRRAGIVGTGGGRPPLALVKKRPPKPRTGSSASRVLIEERGESR